MAKDKLRFETLALHGGAYRADPVSGAVAVPIDLVPESRLAVDPIEPVQKLKLPEALLSPRQREILSMLYDRDMEVAEIAAALDIDPQTVRSTHHKAMIKLRAHFKAKAE